MEVIPTANFQPDISIGGFRIGEPVIALTGLLVCIFCFYAWFRLKKAGSRADPVRLFGIFFGLTGISTLIGAIVGHAFLYALPFEYKIPGWVLGMIGVSALEQVSISNSGVKGAKVLTYVNIAELTLAIWFVTSTLWFPGVEIHSAFGLLAIVVPLEVYAVIKFKRKSSVEILYGVIWLVAAVLPHVLKFSLSRWFSYFDIAHLLMCGAIWQFMRAALKMADEKAAEQV